MPICREQTNEKAKMAGSSSRATKADKQKKARQQTDQRMKHQDAQSRGDSNATREAKMVLSPDDPMAKAKKKRLPIKRRAGIGVSAGVGLRPVSSALAAPETSHGSYISSKSDFLPSCPPAKAAGFLRSISLLKVTTARKLLNEPACLG